MIGLTVATHIVYLYHDVAPFVASVIGRKFWKQTETKQEASPAKIYHEVMLPLRSCMKTEKFGYTEPKKVRFLDEHPGYRDHFKRGNIDYRLQCSQVEPIRLEGDRYFTFGNTYKCTGCTEEDFQRRMQWNYNEMDYMGRDAYANIKAKLEQTLSEDQFHPHTHLPRNLGNAKNRDIAVDGTWV